LDYHHLDPDAFVVTLESLISGREGFMQPQQIADQNPFAPSIVCQHEVLRLPECEVVRDQVLSLRHLWKSRSNEGQFFTLGVASYLDAVDRHHAYLKEAREINPLLWANFDWLCERIRRGFENLLGQPVSYSEECALPGFHIFILDGADQSNNQPSSRAHFDMQWIHAMPGRHPEGTLSFTLPIDEPSGGSSLAIWPIHSHTIRPGFDTLKYASSSPPQIVKYARGQMVVHDGLLLHAIGCASIATPKGYRITFQGHGVKVSERWKLYW
jgi:hypothetical protein